MIPALSTEVILLEQLLNAKEVGQTASYEEIEKCIGTKKRHHITTARKRQLAMKNRVWGAVPKVGIMLLNNQGILSLGASGDQKLKRQAKRNLKVAKCVDYTSLTQEARRENDLRLTNSAVVLGLLEPKEQKKLQVKIANAQHELPAPEVLRDLAE